METFVESALLASTNETAPEKEVSESWFYKLWNMPCSELKTRKVGSGYCDTCHHNNASLESAEPELLEHLIDNYEKHKSDAKAEFAFYRNCTSYCKLRATRGSLAQCQDS